MNGTQRKIAQVLVKMIEQMIKTEELKIAQLRRFGEMLNNLLNTIGRA